MKIFLIKSVAFFFAFQCASAQEGIINNVEKPIDWVNPLIGSDSDHSLSNGNTYPAIAMPWAMNFWTPQTGKMGDGWAYTYSAKKIKGFKQTHQPSPWMNDYGQFSIMPVSGKLRFKEDERESWFSHKSEIVTPYYYSVYLADHDVTTEIAPTERAARFRFTFPETNNAYIVIDAFDKGSYIKILPEENKIIGYTTKNSGGVPKNFKNYFVIIFDKSFTVTKTFDGDKLLDAIENQADHSGAVVGFSTSKGEKINAKVASSFISYEQAERNMNEIGNDNFDQLKEKGKNVWNTELSRIKVGGGTAEQFTTFYSCLYRSLLFPRKFYEFDTKGKVVHYSPYNGKILPGYMFTDTGFWDTFRALYPFLNLMYPELNQQMQEGLSNAYNESGWLPEWASPGLRDVMVGNNSASIVAEAYLKSETKKNPEIENLYRALIHGANNEGPLRAVGRLGVDYYNLLGYVPYDAGINENVARTLEYAYDDFAIYKLGLALNKPKSETDIYKKRSLNYKNLFDSSNNLMRGRNKDGKFQEPFSPFKWGDAFTEGNSWHYSWSVFHDMQGLIDLMGGKDMFVSQLDKVFSLAPIFDESYYGSVIHEIREMQIANMGQYAHGNQPIQHMTYLYSYAGEPWKTQYWVRETMNRMYKSTPDGYCGDEDNGQTSAWYVFSALGFYPVTPVSDQYVIGTPLFKTIKLQLQNGNVVLINAPQNSAENKYVKSMRFNKKTNTNNWLSHAELLKGATIDFEMNDSANKTRGTSKTDFPYSFSNEK